MIKNPSLDLKNSFCFEFLLVKYPMVESYLSMVDGVDDLRFDGVDGVDDLRLMGLMGLMTSV